jgi:CSLREA domain-containing protein
MTRSAIFHAIAILLLCYGARTAVATTRTVTSLADSGNGTLRAAIAASNDGDAIAFSVTGTIGLTSGELLISKSITIVGPGSGLLEVTRATSNDIRIFEVSSNLTVNISGLTLSNGYASGGLLSSEGGALFYQNANVTLTDCVIRGNTAQFEGGAISVSGGALTLTRCILADNTVSDPTNSLGGALIIFAGANVTVTNCTISGNKANFGAGFSNNGGTLTIRDSTFDGNQAATGGDGGAIDSSGGNITMSNCTLSNNSAGNGGAIRSVAAFGTNDSMVALRNCTLFNNAATNGNGGAMMNLGSDNKTATLTVSNSTIAGNSATASGGGIYNSGTSGGNAFVMLDNTILQTGAAGVNLYNVGLGTSITSEGYNLSSDNGNGFLVATGDQINKNPQLGPLQDNGGPTLTMALYPGSPALDQGKNFGVTTDQRGLKRPLDLLGVPNPNGGDGSDIGAVEMQTAPAFVVTTTADHDDGSCTPDDCTLREAINLANAAGGADTITFQSGLSGIIFLSSGLGTLTVTDSVNIIGPGADTLSVSGNSVLRPFRFASGSSTMSGLAIKQGNPPNNAGNTIGGGLINQATLTINDCLFDSNIVHAANGFSAGSNGLDALGGAIHNTGSLILNGCTFSQNQAIGGDGAGNTGVGHTGGTGGIGQGGAVYNDTGGSLSINNCTFSNNSASGGVGGSNPSFGGGNGALGSGGGIANAGTMTVTSTTLSGNHALGGNAGTGNSNPNNGQPGASHGGGLAAISGSSTVGNTIVAGNTTNRNGGPDVNGAFNSNGYNLIGIADNSTGFTATADQVGSAGSPLDAHLSPLQDNGGMTNTFALLSGSPAIDKGNSFGLLFDQRGLVTFDNPGIPNAQGGDARDIGSFELNGTPPQPTRLANVATRLKVDTGDNVLFGGFIVTGTQPKKVIVRALGPSVSAPGVLADPTLELYQGNTLLESNDNWVDSPNKQAIIDSTIPPPNNAEAAIVRSLPANATAYTAIVRGANNSTGIGVVEVYDLDSSADSKLANISTRGFVQTGDDVLIAGTIVVGQTPQQVLVCALGPSLPLQGDLADPTLELRDVNGTLLDANDNWVDSPNKQEILDTGAAPPNSLEAAVIHILPAHGTIYTAIVRGVNNSTGVAVVEVFALH